MSAKYVKPDIIKKYHDDSDYHGLVSMLQDLIFEGRFTPYEIEQAVKLAVKNYDAVELKKAYEFIGIRI